MCLNHSSNTLRYAHRRLLLGKTLMCARLACRHTRACVTRRSQWPGQVCGWCPFSRVSHLETETEDRWICLPCTRWRESLVLSFPPATPLVSSRHFPASLRSSLVMDSWSRYPSPAPGPAAEICGIVRFNETSNGIEYFSSYRPSITSRFDKRIRRVFAWINLCPDRSCVILPSHFSTSTKWLLIRGPSLCINYAALIGSLKGIEEAMSSCVGTMQHAWSTFVSQ